MEPSRYKKTRPYAAAFDDAKCAAPIQGDRGSFQCSRNHQPDNEWCKQHHPDSVAKRLAASDAAFKQRSETRAASFERLALLEKRQILLQKGGNVLVSVIGEVGLLEDCYCMPEGAGSLVHGEDCHIPVVRAALAQWERVLEETVDDDAGGKARLG